MLPRSMLAAAAAVASLTLAAPAAAQIPLPIPTAVPTVVPGAPNQGPAPSPYQANDGKGFRDVLPPGTRGRYNGAELAAFLAAGATVPHCCDQLGMYRDLMYTTPGLKAADVGNYFKDSSFGVPDGQAERTYPPRDDVTIVRDRAFGVPHVYGKTRDGAMFGLGYAGAEDRLFFMDVLRHAGRAKGSYVREYCGNGKKARCRKVLRESLRTALSVPASALYGGDAVCKAAGQDGSQTCYDSVRFRPVGGATQPLIPWINRPTYQQANEIQARVPR